jgi:antitoxin StbD
VPAAAYEAMMELIDDIELLKLVKERINEPTVTVSLDGL